MGAILIDVAQHAARLSGQFDGANLAMEAKFEDLSTADNLAQAQAVHAVTDALVIARDAGWIDNATARRLLSKFAGEPIITETP
jgi:hypothetical protein